MKRGRYTVVFEQDEDAWIVDVPEVPGCHTYGRSLHEARSRIREALSLWVKDAKTAELVERIQLPRHIRLVVETGVSARTDAKNAAEKAKEKLGRAARKLVGSGYSYRDTATLLGLSHQRVAQLVEQQRRTPLATRRPRSAARS